MADIYVDSNAVGTATGADWANAYTTLAAAAAVDGAGDTIWVASDHSETTAGAVILSWAGTLASPTRILSADKTSGEPPSTMSAGAGVFTSGNQGITVANTGQIYVWGITFGVGDGVNSAVLIVNGGTDSVNLENCALQVIGSGTNGRINLTNSTGRITNLKNCSFRYANASQFARHNVVGGQSTMIGCSLASGGTSPTTLFSASQSGLIECIGLDLTNASAGINIFNDTQSGARGMLRNSKLPTSWSGALNVSTPGQGALYLADNCSASDVNYAIERITSFGTIIHETTIVKTNGATDGTTPISWEMTTTADSEWLHQTLKSPDIIRWNDTIGSNISVAVDFLHDSVTNLQDDEIFLELQYLGSNGFPLSVFVSDSAATYLTTPSDQDTSSFGWTTTGLTNPNKQTLSVTISPQEVGFLVATVNIAKPSYTVYVNPKLNIS